MLISTATHFTLYVQNSFNLYVQTSVSIVRTMESETVGHFLALPHFVFGTHSSVELIWDTWTLRISLKVKESFICFSNWCL